MSMTLEVFLTGELEREVSATEAAIAYGYNPKYYAKARRNGIPFERAQSALRSFGISESRVVVGLVKLGYLDSAALATAVERGSFGRSLVEEDAPHPPRRSRLKKGEIDPDAVNKRDLL